MRKNLLIIPYFFLLIVGLVLPSDGNHGITSPKGLAFLSSLGSLAFLFCIKPSKSWDQLKLLGFVLVATSFFFIWLFLGTLINTVPVDSAMDQFKIFLTTLAVVVMTLFLMKERFVLPQTILKFMIYANFSFSLAKVMLVVLHLLGVINLFGVLEKVGLRFMSMAIIGNIGRLQTSVDIVTPFLLFFVLQSEKLQLGFSKKFKIVYQVISLLSIFLSFSRFLLGVAFVSYILYWLTLKPSKVIKGIVLAAVLCFALVLFIGIDNTASIIERRFFSKDNYYSDLARTEQIEALMQQHEEYPYFGMGLGGFTPHLLRDGLLTHSYEVQWVAFFMQFGLFGIAGLLVPVGMIGKEFILTHFSRFKWACFGLFGVWLLSGFTNPYLISLTSGIMYAVFLITIEILKRSQQPVLLDSNQRA